MKLSIETIKPSLSTDNNDIICRVDIKDNLIFKNTEEFKYIIFALINGGVKKIILDIYTLKEIDSMGIGSFIALKKSFPKQNREIIITRCNDQILTLLKPVKIEELIRLFPTIEEGISYLESLRF